jgi:hypothetical protein
VHAAGSQCIICSGCMVDSGCWRPASAPAYLSYPNNYLMVEWHACMPGGLRMHKSLRGLSRFGVSMYCSFIDFMLVV